MFRPVSTICYRTLNPMAQAIAVIGVDSTDRLETRLEDAIGRWQDRTAGLYVLGSYRAVRDVIRDLLANPQVRAIVFDACPEVRRWFSAVWDGSDVPRDIDAEHVTMTRQFVDLYDDDFALRGPQQPFSPIRVTYLR